MVPKSHTQTVVQDLLRVKLTPPRMRSVRVPRAHLLARLDDGLNHKLTLLSAPAGFGKTTLVTEWIAHRDHRREPLPAAWVSLDEGDNDPVRFWRYLLTACQMLDATVGETALAMLRPAQTPSFEVILTPFINELAQLSHSCVLVLEDYHAITNQKVHETIAFLLDHLPATLHLILITRSDPPLPLARLRAQNELCELRTADLRFLSAEIQTFLQQNIPFSLPLKAVALLEQRTEGWATGLQLVTLALQRRQPEGIQDWLDALSGSQRHILDYLADEVLASQPEHVQEFLLKTSFVQRLTAPLCDVLTGQDESQNLLDQLERANLFLIPLDMVQQWYRYHPLFAEAMQAVARRRLDEAVLRELHHRASHWYEQAGYLADAIETALAARSFPRAADLIERIARSEVVQSELYTLRRWLEQLPLELLRQRPTLCLSHAIALLFTSDRSAPATMAAVERSLQLAEQGWRAGENEAQLGQLLACRSMLTFWQGDFQQAVATAKAALARLPEQESFWRGKGLFYAALEKLLLGRINEAQQMLLEAHALGEAVGDSHGMRAAMFLLAEVHVEQAELPRAAQVLRQILDKATDDRFDQGYALTGLAALAYEWNELAEAEEHASQALQMGREHAETRGERFRANALIVPASLLLARVEQARGQIAAARQRLLSLDVDTVLAPLLRMDQRACQIRLALADGDMATADRWAATPPNGSDNSFPLQQERQARTHARLMLAKGEADHALRLLEGWLDDARAAGRTGSELENLALMALAHFAQDNVPEAKQMLILSLRLGQAGGYRRLFLDEGESMTALLRAVYPDVRESLLAIYVRSLLLAFAEEPAEPRSLPAAGVPVLIEPLSPQEERVLRRLAAGLSNPEIAQELIVSLNTIKTQVQTIYRKLDVHSRGEAVDLARRLGLI